MNLAINLVLTEWRCWKCRRWYAGENGASTACPMCAVDTERELHQRITVLRRQVAALKGHNRRLSRRRK